MPIDPNPALDLLTIVEAADLLKLGRLKSQVQHRYVHRGGVAMSRSYQHLSRDERAAIAIDSILKNVKQDDSSY